MAAQLRQARGALLHDGLSRGHLVEDFVKDPKGPRMGWNRTARGASWHNSRPFSDGANRKRYLLTDKSFDHGFRIACSSK